MMRLRSGKLRGQRRRARREFADASAPLRGDAVRPARGGAPGRPGRARCRPPRRCRRGPASAPSCAAPSMPRGQARRRCTQPASARCAREGARVVQALGAWRCGCRRWPAPGAASQAGSPCDEQQQRRVGGLQQRRRVGRVAQRPAAARPAPPSSQACARGQPRGASVGRLAGQRRGRAAPTSALARRGRAPQHCRRRCRRRPAGAARASRPRPGVSQQPQPGARQFARRPSRHRRPRAGSGLGEAVAGAHRLLHRTGSARTTRGRRRGTRTAGRGVRRAAASARAFGRGAVDGVAPARHSASTWPRSRPSRAPRLSATIWFWPAGQRLAVDRDDAAVDRLRPARAAHRPSDRCCGTGLQAVADAGFQRAGR